MKAINRLSRHSSRTTRRPVAANLSPWRREPLPPVHSGAGRVVVWAGARRTPLAAGALTVALVGALVGGAFRMPMLAEASQPGTTFQQTVPGSGTSPGSAGTSGDFVTRFAVASGVSPLARSGGWMSTVGTSVTLSVAGWSPIGAEVPAGGLAQSPGGPAILAGGPSALADGGGSVAGSPGLSEPSGASGGATVAAATAYPVVARASGAPSAPSVPSAPLPRPAALVVAAPAVPLTSAQLTAANAAAAADLTAANALAAANLTAANAAAAAELTAANALAAANLTAANALAAANLTAANAAAAAAAAA